MKVHLLLLVVVTIVHGSRRHVPIFVCDDCRTESTLSWSSDSYYYSSGSHYTAADSYLQSDSYGGRYGHRWSEQSGSSEGTFDISRSRSTASSSTSSSSTSSRRSHRRNRERRMFQNYINDHERHHRGSRKVLSLTGKGRRINKGYSWHESSETDPSSSSSSRSSRSRSPRLPIERLAAGLPSDQSFTIEFSSEHHRRFRRHISRSNRRPITDEESMLPSVLRAKNPEPKGLLGPEKGQRAEERVRREYEPIKF